MRRRKELRWAFSPACCSLTSSRLRQINSRLLDKSSHGGWGRIVTLFRERHRKSNSLHLTASILITAPPDYCPGRYFQWKITAFKWNRLPKLDLFQPPSHP
ncbi:hypothetical protein TNCT_489301 [Trichonephila clavata]|uniref:Uncharacterized protein n=1 Tax=Trichonephila clavata TaxID=2740835 RepID=A0A8X6IJP1_TRICU|nr:hypothetical protein TNCT_489301 [Trichonephila clavata]